MVILESSVCTVMDGDRVLVDANNEEEESCERKYRLETKF